MQDLLVDTVPKPKLKEWCTVVQQAVKGQIQLGNICYDCDNARVTKRLRRDLREALQAIWSNRISGPPAPDAELAADDYLKRIVENGRDKYLCAGKDRPIGDPACSRIVDGRDLLRFNIDLKSKGWFLDDHVEEHIKYLEGHGLVRTAKDEMGGRLPMAWVTTNNEAPPQTDEVYNLALT
jgi:hypothetical protein